MLPRCEVRDISFGIVEELANIPVPEQNRVELFFARLVSISRARPVLFFGKGDINGFTAKDSRHTVGGTQMSEAERAKASSRGWQEIASEVSKETDSAKLAELTQELMKAFAGRDKRGAQNSSPQAAEKVRIADETLRLMKIQDEERRRIARELHDSAGQTLTVLGLSLAQLVKRAEASAADLAKEGKEIEQVVQQLHREIRTTSYLLHPPSLDECGLASALSWYVQGVTERSGLAITLSIAEDFGRLPSDMELAIFRVVQECLTNIHRHAESKTA